MKTKTLWGLFCLLALCACSNDSALDSIEEEITLVQAEDETSVKGMLQFKTEADFNEAVNALGLVEVESRANWVKEHCGEVVSLKDVYDSAMLDAAELDESCMAFEAFRSKYGDYLFFADYKDDGGVYLPVSNEAVASLVNANGDVCINGQVRNMKDVFTYSQLQLLGVAMYDSYSTRSKAEVEKEYDSGWYEEDGRKIRLKCGRQVLIDTGILTTPVTMRMHIEISFRKKTWLGWTNYSSRIDLTGTYVIGSVTLSINESKTADSSHDYYYALPDAIPVVYENMNLRYAPGISANFNVDFRGIPKVLNYQFVLPDAFM